MAKEEPAYHTVTFVLFKAVTQFIRDSPQPNNENFLSSLHQLSGIALCHSSKNCLQILASLPTNSTKVCRTAHVVTCDGWPTTGRLQFCKDGSVNLREDSSYIWVRHGKLQSTFLMERLALHSADATEGNVLWCAYLAGWFVSYSEPSSRLFRNERSITL